MNESVAFTILMLNLLHSNAKFNLRQTKKQTDKLKQISDATREIKENKKKEEDYTNQLVKTTLFGFLLIVVIALILIRLNKPDFLVVLYLIAIFGYIARLTIIIVQYIYFSFQESRDIIICRLIINFCRKYDYCLPTLVEYDETLIKHNNDLKHLITEKAKERKTIFILKRNFSKELLIEMKNNFCIAKENNKRFFQRLLDILPIILASIIAFSIFLLFPNLQQYFEEKNYNGIFGSSLAIYLIVPVLKFILSSVPPTIEIYSKCISLLERAIN